MYSISYHSVELHGEVIVHAREGCEGHFTKIDFALHIIKVNTHLWESLADFLGNLYHLLQILRSRNWSVLYTRISQILVHRRPGIDVIQVIDSLSSPTSAFQLTVVAHKVILSLAVNTPYLVVDSGF